ncbi:MAG: universal stress protein [Nitrospirae bacterium]|nr:universal stress protein [Nitrospirota bacterium]
MPRHPFKKILVAVDGSFHAGIAARYAFAFAGTFNAKLYVTAVITEEMEEHEEKAVAAAVAKVLDEATDILPDIPSNRPPDIASNRPMDIEGVLLKGDVIRAINRFVRDNKIDLVIASTRGPHRDQRFFVRSVTSGLMSKLPCSVIGIKVTHPGRSIRPKKVLVPVIGDGYQDKERADVAEALHGRFASSLSLFHVIELSALSIKRLDPQKKERLIASAEKRLAPFMDELNRRGIDAGKKIVLGRNAREEVISEASHHKYDLIIVGATTRNIVKRVVSGNPVEEILRDTPCDVMLLHFNPP